MLEEVYEILLKNGIKMDYGIKFTLVGTHVFASLDGNDWYLLVFDDGLADVIPLALKNSIPYELGVKLGFYDVTV